MRGTVVQIGAYMLVRPEDVKRVIPQLFYAVVVATTRSSVRVESVTPGITGAFVLTKSTAMTRLVTEDEARGDQQGCWLRKAVWYTARGQHSYGQVVRTAPGQLVVATRNGEKTVSSSQVQDEVYPVVALVMGSVRWAAREWTRARLEAAHEQLLDLVMDGQNGRPVTVGDLAAAIPGLAELCEQQTEWTGPISGVLGTTSLTHVLKYVYFVEGGRPIPSNQRAQIGATFCEEPVVTQPITARPEDTDSFFDSWIDDDEDEVAAEGDTDAQVTVQGTQPARLPRLPAMPPLSRRISRNGGQVEMRAPDTGTGSGSIGLLEAEVEVIELIRKYKPHLLAHYLSKDSSPTSKRAPPIATDATILHSAKRARTGFAPTIEQERIHHVISNEEQAGKSGDAFVEFVSSLSVAQFAMHPGVIMRLYDLQFGMRGLSIMHFRRVGFIDRLRMLSPASAAASDSSSGAPVAPAPAAWAELGSATRSFVDYCRSMCDPVTVQVAEALDQFVLTLEGWRQFNDHDLPLLTLWIDATLERYRNAVVADLNHDTQSRHQAPSWFSTTNPEIHSLLLTAIGERLQLNGGAGALSRALEGSSHRHDTSSHRAPQAAGERRIPTDVIMNIPTKDGKEVCLHSLSRRGCSSTDSARCTYKNRAHFFPKTLPPKLRQYINSRLGGVIKMYEQA
jgi:hypothetical protein